MWFIKLAKSPLLELATPEVRQVMLKNLGLRVGHSGISQFVLHDQHADHGERFEPAGHSESVSALYLSHP